MAYGLDTGGGFAGGLAGGLQFGLQQGESLYNQQAQRDLEKQRLGQEAGFRQQEIGFRQKESDRADITQRLELERHQDDAYQKDIEDLTRKAAGAQGHEQDMLTVRLHALEDQRRQLHEHSHLQIVDHGLDQTQADAKALAKGDIDYHDLPPNRASNVVAQAVYAPAIDAVDGDHHITPTNQDGHAPLNQAHDEFLDRSAAGDHLGAAKAAFPLVAGHLPAYAPDHELFSPGLSHGDTDMAADDPHAVIGKGYDIVGRKGVVLAALQSDPDLQDIVKFAHQNGATQQQMAALHTVAAVGGRDRLKQAAGPTDLERSYDQHKAEAIQNGAKPDEAHQQAMEKAVAETTEQHEKRMRDWYSANNYKIPDDLKQPEKEKAIEQLAKGYQATGKYTADQATAKATREVYSPGIAEAELRTAAEAPLHQAQIAEMNARSKRLQRQGIIPYQGTDGHIYSSDPDDPSTLVDETGQSKPPDVQVNRIGNPRAAVKPDVVLMQDPNNPELKVPVLVHDDGTFSKLQERGAESSGALPPQALSALKADHVTTFKNGQQWTLKDGKPVQLK